VAGSFEHIDGVWEEFCDGVEGFDGAPGAARKINDQSGTTDDGRLAREVGTGEMGASDLAHFFPEAGDGALADGDGSFGSDVARADSGAAGGEDQIDQARKLDEQGAQGIKIVTDYVRSGDLPAKSGAALRDSATGEVFAVATGDGITDSYDGDAHDLYFVK
jgi:hypothetical protein